MYNHRSTDPSVIAMIIGLLFILCFGVFGTLRCAASISGAAKEEAQKNALQWARELQLDGNITVTCSNRDSDGDGYYGCSVAQRTENKTEIHQIECTAAYALTDSCRLVKMVSKQ